MLKCMANQLKNPPDSVPWERWPTKLETSSLAVFRYVICPADQPFLSALLLPHEQQRADRFMQLADRDRFVAGRGLLRWLAGQLTGTLPLKIQLETGPYGKPELKNTEGSPVNWHVNVSHAGEWVLLAFGNVPVGIDVEWINPNWPYEDLIPTTFNPEDQASLVASADPRTLFYRFWTRKESLLKATGQGLTNDFTAVSSSKGVYKLANKPLGEMGNWRATSFLVAPDYIGAVACQEPLPELRFFTVEELG